MKAVTILRQQEYEATAGAKALNTFVAGGL